jgi:hypothetical protein
LLDFGAVEVIEVLEELRMSLDGRVAGTYKLSEPDEGAVVLVLAL